MKTVKSTFSVSFFLKRNAKKSNGTEELMRISGHKSPAAFMRYIKVDNMQAANRLKELRAKLAR